MAAKKTTRKAPDLHLQTLKAIQATIETQIGGLRDELKSEIGGLRNEFKSEIGGLRREFKSEIGGLRGEMQTGFGGLRDDMQTGFTGLRDEMKTGFGGLRDDVRRLEARSASLEDAVNQGFAFLGARVDGVGARVDHLRDNIGGAYRSHDERLTALERRVFRRDDDEDDDGDA